MKYFLSVFQVLMAMPEVTRGSGLAVCLCLLLLLSPGPSLTASYYEKYLLSPYHFSTRQVQYSTVQYSTVQKAELKSGN